MLPEDFYKVQGMFYISPTSSSAQQRRFKVERWQPLEIDGYRSSPISGGTIQMWYIPEFKKFKRFSGRVSGRMPPGWEDYVALQSALTLAIKEANVEQFQMLSTERDRKRILIQEALTPRDDFIPDSIQDYYGRYENTRNLLRFDERYFKYRVMGNFLYLIEIEYIGI